MLPQARRQPAGLASAEAAGVGGASASTSSADNAATPPHRPVSANGAGWQQQNGSHPAAASAEVSMQLAPGSLQAEFSSGSGSAGAVAAEANGAAPGQAEGSASGVDEHLLMPISVLLSLLSSKSYPREASDRCRRDVSGSRHGMPSVVRLFIPRQ